MDDSAATESIQHHMANGSLKRFNFISPSWRVVGYLAEHPCSVKDYDSTKVKRRAHREAIWQVQTWALSDQNTNGLLIALCYVVHPKKKKQVIMLWKKEAARGEKVSPSA